MCISAAPTAAACVRNVVRAASGCTGFRQIMAKTCNMHDARHTFLS